MQILQREKTPQRDRAKHRDSAEQLRWRLQPVIGERGRKLQPQVIQRMGAEQATHALTFRPDHSLGGDHLDLEEIFEIKYLSNVGFDRAF